MTEQTNTEEQELVQRVVALAASRGWTFEDTCRNIADRMESQGADPALVPAIRTLPKEDMHPENKKHFIRMLRLFAEKGGEGLYDPVYNRNYIMERRGDRVLARGLAEYLDDPKIPGDTDGINWYHDLCSHLVDAFEEFRTHAKWSALRTEYYTETEGYEIPDLVNFHVDPTHRLLVAHGFAYLVTALSGQLWLRHRLEAYIDAQHTCIDQAWRRFVRVGYRDLMPHITEEGHRRNRGVFGETSLTTYASASCVVFRFQRSNGGPQVTYVADESDMWGVRSGSDFTTTPFQTCIDMIDEVTANWALEKMEPSPIGYHGP